MGRSEPSAEEGPQGASRSGHQVTREVARNATVQVVGEGLSKLASLALYVVVARVAGPEEFGNLIFALSLSLLTTSVAGFGMEGVVIRGVAREKHIAGRLLTDAITVKVVFGSVGILVAFVVTVVGNYATEVQLAVVMLAVGSVLDLIAKSHYAVFQALDDMRPMAGCLLLQRIWVAGAGIVIVLAGGRLVPLAIAFVSGSAVALLTASAWLAHMGVKPVRRLSFSGAKWLARSSFGLGITQVFNTVLFRADATMLSLFKGNLAVGLYGVAYRLLESTLFITYDFVAALAPTLARLRRNTTPTIARAYEMGCRVLALLLVPIGDVLVAYPHAIVQLLYGSKYQAADGVMRILGGAAVTYGFAYLASYTLVLQDRDRVLPWVHLGVMIQNIALNLVLIPTLSYTGAAISTTVSETTRMVILMWYVYRAAGAIRLWRVLLAPAVGTVALAAVAVGVGTGLAELVVGVLAYTACALAVEHLAFPSDARFLRAALLRRAAAAEAQIV